MLLKRRRHKNNKSPRRRSRIIPDAGGNIVLTSASQLQINLLSVAVKTLHFLGTIPGVTIDAVSAKNGPGTGRIRSTATGSLLSWRAPGSTVYGPDVPVPIDGTYVLLDGSDANKFVRISVLTAFLKGPSESQVFLDDVFNNVVGGQDVTAVDATAGEVTTYTADLKNVEATPIMALRVWIDAATTGLEISSDGTNWVSPTNEPTSLQFGTIIPGNSTTLHIRRTISPGAIADPNVLNVLHFGWGGAQPGFGTPNLDSFSGSLHAVWEMEEPSGSLVDVARSRIAIPTADPVYNQAALISGAIAFNGDDYFTSDPLPASFSGDFTFSLWFMRNNAHGSFFNLVNDANTINYGFLLFSVGGNDFAFRRDKPTTLDFYDQLFTINISQWYHAVFRRSAGVHDLFVDGVKNPGVPVASINDTTSMVGTRIKIGRGIFGSTTAQKWFNGFMDQFAAWSISLSDAAIAELYNGGLGRLYQQSSMPNRLHDMRGKYRIFNNTEYRYFRRNDGIAPLETDTPFATSSSLPNTSPDLFADGIWLLSVSYFNGVIDSGFLPVGPNGETFLRIDVQGGTAKGSPPSAPHDVRLELRPNGVVRVHALYVQTGSLRAGDWAITYTANGVDPLEPPAIAPTTTQTIAGSRVSILAFDLPAQADGTTIKVRVQTRRNDGGGTFVYSEGSAVLQATADAIGPTQPLTTQRWPGRLPEDF